MNLNKLIFNIGLFKRIDGDTAICLECKEANVEKKFVLSLNLHRFQIFNFIVIDSP